MIVSNLFLLFLLICLWLKRHFSYWSRRGIFQLNSLWFFGDMKPAIDKELQLGLRIKEIVDEFKQHGVKYGGMYMFFKKTFIPVDRELMRLIYFKDFHHFQGTGIFSHEKDLLGLNLLSAEGSRWKNMRSSLMPIFSANKIKLMFSIMLEKTEKLNQTIENYVTNQISCEGKDLMERYATDVVVSTAFGLDCDSLDDPKNEFRQHKQDFFVGSPFKLFLEAVLPWSILGYFGHKAIGDQELEDFFVNKIKKTVADRKNHNVKKKDFIELLMSINKLKFDPNFMKKRRHSHLGRRRSSLSNQRRDSYLGDRRNSFFEQETITTEQMAAQAFLFYVGGFETTSTTMTFALLNLALHQGLQEKCRQEVFKVLNKYEGQMSYAAVNELDYLEQFVYESMRHYPPFNLQSRTCTKDYIIPGTSHTLEKGTQVLMCVLGVHMDPQYYPEPNKFNPEHFSKDNKKLRPDGTFLAFGHGPRKCIGMKLGLINAKLGLASIIQNYQVTLDSRTQLPIKLDPKSFVTSSREPIWLNFVKYA